MSREFGTIMCFLLLSLKKLIYLSGSPPPFGPGTQCSAPQVLWQCVCFSPSRLWTEFRQCLPGEGHWGVTEPVTFGGHFTQRSVACSLAFCCILAPAHLNRSVYFQFPLVIKTVFMNIGINSTGFAALRLKAFCCLINSQRHFIFNIASAPWLDSTPSDGFHLQRQA